MVAVLLMVPVKHEVFLFASNHTHILYAASGLSLKTYTAQPGLQVMSGPALNYTHTHTNLYFGSLWCASPSTYSSAVFFKLFFIIVMMKFLMSVMKPDYNLNLNSMLALIK